MKKIIGIILMMVMVMTIATAMANDDPIWRDVTEEWKIENERIYKTFLDTEYYSDGFQMYNYACMAAYNVYLNTPEDMTLEEMEKTVEEQMKNVYDVNAKVTINIIGRNEYYGRNVIEIIIDGNKDLRELDEANLRKDIYENPVTGIYMICYDHY